jgi:D-arginine dehydrogenase
MSRYDFAVIGAGIAGASVAYELQARGSTVLLEREPMPGYHTTGRSAAVLLESYGNPSGRMLAQGSRSFLESPPQGFAPHPLVTPKPLLWIGREDQRERLAVDLEAGRVLGAELHPLDGAGVRELCPVLREDYVAAATLEPGAMIIDVASLLEGFLRGLRAKGGQVQTRAEVTHLERVGELWEVTAGEQTYSAPVVVNAAGAWCDDIARLAGVRTIGLEPLRRTAITFDGPAGYDFQSWPCVIDADEEFYFKPEGAQILGSPADEIPSEPCDAVAEDYEVALAADRIQRATTLEVKHIRQKWAGLRSFVADRSLVLGMDAESPGFFWLAGQGGFGIMTSPAAARAATSLIVDGALPGDLDALGLTPEVLSPEREGLKRG